VSDRLWVRGTPTAGAVRSNGIVQPSPLLDEDDGLGQRVEDLVVQGVPEPPKHLVTSRAQPFRRSERLGRISEHTPDLRLRALLLRFRCSPVLPAYAGSLLAPIALERLHHSKPDGVDGERAQGHVGPLGDDRDQPVLSGL